MCILSVLRNMFRTSLVFLSFSIYLKENLSLKCSVKSKECSYLIELTVFQIFHLD